MSTPQILMLIAAFLLLTVGSFIYFVATWDADKEQPVSLIFDGKRAPGTFALSSRLPKISPPEAPANKRAIT